MGNRRLAVIGVLALAGCDSISAAPIEGDGLMQLVYLLCLLVFLGFGLGAFRQDGFVRTMRNIAIYAALFVALMVGYGYRAELGDAWDRLRGEVLPSAPVAGASGEISLRRGIDGQFLTDARINGTPVRFLVDTGASTVVLPFEIAERAGISTDELIFNQPVQTANGMAFSARVTLPAIEVGPIRMTSVRATVAEPGRLGVPLLGMTFLDRLSSYTVQGNTLTLRR